MTVTPAIAATGAAAFQLAADFETSMSQVSGALNDPAADMESLRDLALQLGSDTIFSASECGAAMVELAKGGLTEADIKAGALQTTLDLAAAGELDLADAANTVVQSMGVAQRLLVALHLLLGHRYVGLEARPLLGRHALLAYLALGLSEDVELLLRRCELPAVVLLLLREQLRVAGIQL